MFAIVVTLIKQIERCLRWFEILSFEVLKTLAFLVVVWKIAAHELSQLSLFMNNVGILY